MRTRKKMTTGKSKRHIFIVDDHPTFRAGIRSIFADHPEYIVSGEAGSCEAARGQIKLIRVDLLILDIALPGHNGVRCIEEMKALKPEIKILILTMHRDWDYLSQARRNGAAGYLLKESKPTEILEAVDAIFAGQTCFPDRPEAAPELQSTKIQILSAREREILSYIAKGLSNQEIAALLGISKRTVESHRFHIGEKLELQGPAALLRFALDTVGSK